MLKYLDIVKLLGPAWVAWRLLYALRQRLGVIKRNTPILEWEDIPAPEITWKFFAVEVKNEAVGTLAEEILQGRFTYFFHHHSPLKTKLNWFSNPFEDSSSTHPALSQAHWTKIPDFGNGDIKCIWELSRFAWVYPLVHAYQTTANEEYCESFWSLLEDWAGHNPPNRGVHWKCGQEIAVRMFALTTAYFAFRSSATSFPSRHLLLRRILYASARRIEANIDYALSQKNNHGISEATGLFTAGVLLQNRAWLEKGRKLLESQAQELVYVDGSFSQHSSNYHRVMLHACLWAICIGRANGIEFSSNFKKKMRLAGNWLMALVDPVSGKMPNLGSNDGALVLPVSHCDYTDYRPTIQAVGAVLDNSGWLPQGPWDDLAEWLSPGFNVHTMDSIERTCPPIESFPEGGYAVLRCGNAKLIFRCPQRFQHRPGQCDLLHVDIWHGGVNLLRDAGTYSYNCPSPWQEYFESTAAHNTIKFDNHEQMPRLSHFLYGRWPKLMVKADLSKRVIEAGFTDWKLCRHSRRVTVTPTGYEITDAIAGCFNRAVMRWRLAPEMDWNLKGKTCTVDAIRIQVDAGDGLVAMRLAEGWESLYYQEKHQIPVFETEVDFSCRRIVTRIDLPRTFSSGATIS